MPLSSQPPFRTRPPGRRAAPLALVVVCGVLAAMPAAAAAVNGPAAIAALNHQRATAGIEPVTEDPAKTEACRQHAEYQRLNGEVTHEEQEGRPGYTEAGSRAAGASVLSSMDSYSDLGVSTWESAPIHLMQTLNPWLRTTGASGGCLNTLGDKNRVFDRVSTYGYPGDGTDYPASELAGEIPAAPPEIVGLGVNVVTGPHLFVFVAGPGSWSDYNGALISASLTGPSGPVEIRTVDNSESSNGRYLSPGAVIVPVAPLTPGATYTASATFQPAGELMRPGSPAMPRHSHTWSFRAVEGRVDATTRPVGGTGKVTRGPVVSDEAEGGSGAGSGPGSGAGGGSGVGVRRPEVGSVTLARRQLRVRAVNVKTLTATIAEWKARTVRRGGRTQRTMSWVTVRRVTIGGLGGRAVTSKRFAALKAGRRYRVQLRTGKGVLIVTRTVKAGLTVSR